MASRSMMRSVSAPVADVAPPPSVAVALGASAFRCSTTRRDLATSYRSYKAAWSAIEQLQVLGASCRRLGERAAEVLTAVRDKLELVERDDLESKRGKVVLERSYEYQGQSSKAGQSGEAAGNTVFKIQSAMIDLQAFVTDHSANSNHSRLALLVDELPKTTNSLAKLTQSLVNCISTYSLSPVISTRDWSQEDASDLAKDHLALPRLFQLSITLRGPVYDRFIKTRTDTPPSNETPGQRRAAFVEWCLAANPILRPGHAGTPTTAQVGAGLTSPTGPSLAPVKPSMIGRGLPTSVTNAGAGGVSMRRAATQPLNFQRSPSSTVPTLVPPVTTAPLVVNTPAPGVGAKSSDGLLESSHTSPARTVIPPSQSDTVVESSRPPTAPPIHSGPSTSIPVVHAATTSLDAESDPVPTDPALAPSSPIRMAPTVASKPSQDDLDDGRSSSHVRLDQSTSSTESSFAMSNSSSMGSILFDPVLAPIVAGVDERSEVDACSGEGTETVNSSTAGSGSEPQVEEETTEESEQIAIPPNEEVNERAESRPDENAAKAEAEAQPFIVQQQVGESVLGLALDTPLPVSPLVDVTASPIFSSQISGAATASSPVKLLDPFPVESAHGPVSLLEPFPTPSSPTLPPSPSLVVTSFDDADRSRPDIPPSPPPKPSSRAFRILSLDGGGLVGPIPQLLALKRHLAAEVGETDCSVPARHFDLIVGTSSSALPAVLLGHLGLSIDETLEICAQVSRDALGLEGPTTSSADPNRIKVAATKPRRVGMWSRFFTRGGRASSSRASTPTRPNPDDRRRALDTALKRLVPSATATATDFVPRRPGQPSCRAAVLAFARPDPTSRAVEHWLSVGTSDDDDERMKLSLVDVVQASIAFSPSPSSSSSSSPRTAWVPSPTSLNPAPSALEYATPWSSSRNHRGGVQLVSVSIGYDLASIPTNVRDAVVGAGIDPTTTTDRGGGSRRRKPTATTTNPTTRRSRIEGLVEVKRFGAANAAAHEALVVRLARLRRDSDEDRVELNRIEPGLDASALVERDECELVGVWRNQFESLEGTSTRTGLVDKASFLATAAVPPSTPRQTSPSRLNLVASAPNSPSSFYSQPPPSSSPPVSPGSSSTKTTTARTGGPEIRLSSGGVGRGGFLRSTLSAVDLVGVGREGPRGLNSSWSFSSSSPPSSSKTMAQRPRDETDEEEVEEEEEVIGRAGEGRGGRGGHAGGLRSSISLGDVVFGAIEDGQGRSLGSSNNSFFATRGGERVEFGGPHGGGLYHSRKGQASLQDLAL